MQTLLKKLLKGEELTEAEMASEDYSSAVEAAQEIQKSHPEVKLWPAEAIGGMISLMENEGMDFDEALSEIRKELNQNVRPKFFPEDKD